VVSYRTQNALNGGSFVPLVAIDGSDTELETHTFAVRNGGGVGTLEVRVDVVGAGPSGVAGACGFVKEISLYEVLNPVGEGLRRPNWLVGGAEEAALEVFSGGRDPAEIMVAEPGLEHELDLSQEAATTDASGVRWRAQSAGAPAGASLEFPRPVSGVTFAPGSPLYLDLNVALVQGLAARGEVVHLQGSAGEGVAPRKFASALPGGDLPPHLTSAYRFIDRTMVLLPVEARRLTGTRLSFTHTALASGAAVYFDSLFLYFHDAQASAEVVAEAARGGPGRALHTVRLRSARRGPVSVRCHWLGAAGPALSSSALTLVFE
jgi:hypothetical protein